MWGLGWGTCTTSVHHVLVKLHVHAYVIYLYIYINILYTRTYSWCVRPLRR